MLKIPQRHMQKEHNLGNTLQELIILPYNCHHFIYRAMVIAEINQQWNNLEIVLVEVHPDKRETRGICQYISHILWNKKKVNPRGSHQVKQQRDAINLSSTCSFALVSLTFTLKRIWKMGKKGCSERVGVTECSSKSSMLFSSGVQASTNMRCKVFSESPLPP